MSLCYTDIKESLRERNTETMVMGITFREESFPFRQEKEFPNDMFVFFSIFSHNIGYSRSFCLVLQSGKDENRCFQCCSKPNTSSKASKAAVSNTALAELLAKVSEVSWSVQVVFDASYLSAFRRSPQTKLCISLGSA